MKSEFQVFIEGENAQVPGHLSGQILSQVREALSPSGFLVFLKVMAIHFTVAAFTLSVCPQLGFRLLGDGMGLMHLFMGLGPYGCMMACGGFFLGTSMMAATLILRPEELKVFRKTRWLEVMSLAGLSFVVFFAINPEIAIGIAGAWLFGSIAAALAVFEIGWRIRVGAFVYK